MSLQLTYQDYGQGDPILILHGLFGSKQNWKSIATSLSETHRVITVDLRNHGESPHNDQMTYPLMAKDIQDFIQTQHLKKITLIGHSMGGKVGMQLAHDAPSLIEKLIIVDIAPVTYPRQHDEVLAALSEVPVQNLKTRSEADPYLSKHLSDPALKQFLLTNLKKQENNYYDWQFNLNAIINQYQNIAKAPSFNHDISTPTLFIKGDDSEYINSRIIKEIERFFTDFKIETILNAGHWVHAEQSETFLTTIKKDLPFK
ncbi:alpha/beta hydrolase [Candidatus Marinamargulisbacteria bacterium SCGC AG-439-L15]|nr:alpha/beta hydrolase [Candidatus Marinamargulisbacteria bacterium SCGC AG-439-L15]